MTVSGRRAKEKDFENWEDECLGVEGSLRALKRVWIWLSPSNERLVSGRRAVQEDSQDVFATAGYD